MDKLDAQFISGEYDPFGKRPLTVRLTNLETAPKTTYTGILSPLKPVVHKGYQRVPKLIRVYMGGKLLVSLR